MGYKRKIESQRGREHPCIEAVVEPHDGAEPFVRDEKDVGGRTRQIAEGHGAAQGEGYRHAASCLSLDLRDQGRRIDAGHGKDERHVRGNSRLPGVMFGGDGPRSTPVPRAPCRDMTRPGGRRCSLFIDAIAFSFPRRGMQIRAVSRVPAVWR